ncbi:MAG TPA: hypothetical protein VMI52_03600 [Acetobacteraceae bacterium]|nr:hypothetical protein [Acetobacteraceae bacterium]
MTLILRPLLNTTATLLEQLWHARMRKPVSVLLPDWMDPGLTDAVADPIATETETALRARLLAIGAQLRAVSPVATARDVLRRPDADAGRRAALLALAGAAEWTRVARAPGSFRCTRISADGLTYRIDMESAGGAGHAEHAAIALRQTLHVEGAERPRSLVQTADTTCFSLLCGVRDLVVLLVREGEGHLAREVAQLGGLPAELLPEALLPGTMPDVAGARRLAG